MSDHQLPFALVTGASVGIGRALAIECACRNMNLALIDLPDSCLEQTITYLRKNYSITIRSLKVDLTTPNAAEKIYHWTQKEDITVGMLINNAGKGHLGPFTDYEHTFYEKMVRLNIESVVLLTRLFLPEMKKLERAYIMNLGSIASFYPIPYKIVYAGSKSFIFSFSRALKEELRHTGVRVSVLCPGPILTNQEVIQRIRHTGFWAKLSAMQPSRMAHIAIDQLLKGNTVIIPGRVNRIFKYASAIVPTFIKQKVLVKKFNVKEKI